MWLATDLFTYQCRSPILIGLSGLSGKISSKVLLKMTINFVLGGLLIIFQNLSPRQKTKVFYLLTILFQKSSWNCFKKVYHVSKCLSFSKKSIMSGSGIQLLGWLLIKKKTCLFFRTRQVNQLRSSETHLILKKGHVFFLISNRPIIHLS